MYKQIPLKIELVGIVLGLIGCFCLLSDPKACRQDGTIGNLSVYVFDFASAFFGALYFILNAKNVSEIPLCTLILVMNAHQFVMQSIVAKFIFDGRV